MGGLALEGEEVCSVYSVKGELVKGRGVWEAW